MSGGSFDYLYMQFDGTSGRTDLLRAMVARCEDFAAEGGEHAAAWNAALAELRGLQHELARAEAEGERLSGLLRTVEWICSCDYGEGDLAPELERLRAKP